MPSNKNIIEFLQVKSISFANAVKNVSFIYVLKYKNVLQFNEIEVEGKGTRYLGGLVGHMQWLLPNKPPFRYRARAVKWIFALVERKPKYDLNYNKSYITMQE